MNIIPWLPLEKVGSYDFYNDDDLFSVPEGMIFVFGSNRAGRHGKGAAFTAMCQYGAINGVGEGIQGEAYGIPTKSVTIQSLPLSEIQKGVERFKAFTLANPKLQFFVTAIGCGLAGYSAKDIAPMFRGAINCWFPASWRFYIEGMD